MRTLRVDLFTMFLAVLGTLGAALVLLRDSFYGVSLGNDSFLYIKAAQYLLEQNAFTFHDYPPLFPLTLAAVGRLGPDVIDAAAYVNAAAFGLTVFTTAMWARSRVQSRFLVVWAGCVCALSLLLAGLAASVFTDHLLILFVVLSLFMLDQFLDNRKGSFLFLAAVCAALACLSRYIGIAVIASALLLLLFQRDMTLAAKVRNGASYIFIALAPICLWMLRNFLDIGLLTGRSYPTGFSLLGSLHKTTSEFAQWTFGNFGFDLLDTMLARTYGIVISGGPSVAGVGLKIAVLLYLVLVVGYLLLRLNRSGALSTKWRVWRVPAIFVSIYLCFLAILLPLTDILLPVRYLGPIYPPSLIAAMLALNEFFRYAASGRPLGTLSLLQRWNAGLAKRMTISVPTLILTSGLSLWLLQHVSANYDDIKHWRNNDRWYYSSRQWIESETIDYIQSAPLAGPFWSNDDRALYLLADIRDERSLREGNASLPSSNWWNIDGSRGVNPERAAANASSDGIDSYFVWFHQGRYAYDGYGIVEIAALPGMELVAELRDGVILKSALDSADSAGTLEEGGLLKVILKEAHLIIRADFDVYLDTDRLIYVREGCNNNNVGPQFFLHVDPVDSSDLPRHRRRHGFDNRDFEYVHGFTPGGVCITVRNLPNYEIAEIRTGQYTTQGLVWEAAFSFNDVEAVETNEQIDIDALRQNSRPVIRAEFDVYLDQGANRLIYVRDECTDADVAPRFFLHVDPVDVNDLPSRRKQHGYDNLDFGFAGPGFRIGERCAAVRGLPQYGIAAIRTGQYVSGEGQLWKGEALWPAEEE